jgi:hypothetical protein
MALKLKLGDTELPKKAVSFKAPGELYLNLNRFREYIQKETGKKVSNAELCISIIEQHLKSEADFWKRREEFPGNEPQGNNRGDDDSLGSSPQAPAASYSNGNGGGSEAVTS